MSSSAERIEAAAKAYAPELWPEVDELAQYSPMQRGQLAMLRQATVSRITAALQAADDLGKPALQVGTFEVPEDAAIVEQTLVAFSYIDHHGKTAYGVRTIGQGLPTTWLGMAELAKHFLLEQQAGNGWQIRPTNDEEEGGS